MIYTTDLKQGHTLSLDADLLCSMEAQRHKGGLSVLSLAQHLYKHGGAGPNTSQIHPNLF